MAGRSGRGGARRFASTDHLGVEAVAAFVDGELVPVARRRATSHLMACPECRDEVARQREAARRLRDSGEIRVPAALRGRLAALAQETVGAPGPDAPAPAEATAGDPGAAADAGTPPPRPAGSTAAARAARRRAGLVAALGLALRGLRHPRTPGPRR
ncbi:anti-sigma factor family protein [Corynebacterium sphenisci]|uniref:anti-sigma factor family protein n=1 Tax=Corynebacterium sphenisci TaxID=191493 RepID=UPI0009534C59|nr:zf-HC2 domain-containing protein [Corynebacterium sphenisci]